VPRGGGSLRWIQASAAELEDHFGPDSLDAVVSCLAMSELSLDEQRYALKTIATCLVPGGDLVLADEVVPTERWRRVAHRLARAPLAALRADPDHDPGRGRSAGSGSQGRLHRAVRGLPRRRHLPHPARPKARVSTFLADLRDLVLRALPHRAPTGLVRLGDPGRASPVLLTGNFTLTVGRLRRTLRGRDAWLLCADSRGINVWCAAGGGHLTHHDVISVLRTSGIGEQVDHHELVLPQLAATGVERPAITDATGWQTRWGPAHMEDLPAFLDRGAHSRRSDRVVRFPARERAEMASMWALPMVLLSTPLVGWLAGWPLALAAAVAVLCTVFGLFLALPWVPVVGGRRWLSYAAFALPSIGLGAGLLLLLAATSTPHLLGLGGLVLVAVGVLSLDLAGTTPWYGSTINTFHNQAKVELVSERCTGAADCVLVCPRDVLVMDGHAHKVTIARPEQCIQCGACIVQCPTDALRFRYQDGRVAEAPTVRSTRMNMLGRRTVAVKGTVRRGSDGPDQGAPGA